MLILCTKYLVLPPFAWITTSVQHSMEAISLWHCSGVMEAQVALTAAFRSSALLVQVSLIFVLIIQAMWVCWPIKHSNTVVIEPAFGIFGSVGRCQVLLENENQHLHKACQQKEAWSALRFPGRWLHWLWTSENTLDQHQQTAADPKSSFHNKVNFACHLEINVPEAGGRVERHRINIAWGPVWRFHSQWWVGLPSHLLYMYKEYNIFFLVV